MASHLLPFATLTPCRTQISLAQETLDIFSVVANRLGIWCLKADLEDLAFAVIHPEEHKALSKQVRAPVLCVVRTRLWMSMCVWGVVRGMLRFPRQWAKCARRSKACYG